MSQASAIPSAPDPPHGGAGLVVLDQSRRPVNCSPLAPPLHAITETLPGVLRLSYDVRGDGRTALAGPDPGPARPSHGWSGRTARLPWLTGVNGHAGCRPAAGRG